MFSLRPLAFVALFAVVAVADVPTIEDVTPTQAAIGTTFFISGSGFGSRPRAYLESNATQKRYPLKVSMRSDTSFQATVRRAVVGQCDLVVVPRDRAPLRFAAISVVGPAITSVTPAEAEPGTVVSLECPMCGTKKGRVMMAGMRAKVLAWDGTAGRIDIVVPKHAPAGLTQVAVLNSLQQSSPAPITILAPAASK